MSIYHHMMNHRNRLLGLLIGMFSILLSGCTILQFQGKFTVPLIGTNRPALVAQMPTATPPGTVTPQADGEVQMILEQDSEQAPAGASTRFWIKSLPNWVDMDPITWAVTGLPTGVTYKIQQTPYPPENGLIISTPNTITVGEYHFQIRAVSPHRTWQNNATLKVIPCLENVSPGTYTLTGKDNGFSFRPENRGPSSMYTVLSSPIMIFCPAKIPRKLRLTIMGGTSETGAPADIEHVGISLRRFLTWPPLSGGYTPGDSEILATPSATLEWNITSGAYSLFFVQNQLAATPGYNQQFPRVSVTYLLEVLPAQ